MSTPERRGGIGGISLGGILVIVGIVVMLAWSVLLGIIIVLIGLKRPNAPFCGPSWS